MNLKDIISKVVFTHLEFHNGNSNAEGLIDKIYDNLELDEHIISQIVYKTVVKMTTEDANKVAKSLQKHKDLIFKMKENL